MGLVAFSIVTDVFWLSIYYIYYRKDDSTIDQGQERVLKIFTLVLSIINLIFKIPVIF